MSGTNGPDWKDTRLNTAYWEAQAVLERQIDILSDIDDKAMRTVRINVLLIGILLSATQLPNAGVIFNELIVLGGISLLISLIAGVYTYSESYPNLGVSADELRDLKASTDSGNPEWQREILSDYAEWIEENEITNRVNAYLLLGTQFFLVLGLILISVGVGISFT